MLSSNQIDLWCSDSQAVGARIGANGANGVVEQSKTPEASGLIAGDALARHRFRQSGSPKGLATPSKFFSLNSFTIQLSCN
jgi:hypothetical protein